MSPCCLASIYRELVGIPEPVHPRNSVGLLIPSFLFPSSPERPPSRLSPDATGRCSHPLSIRNLDGAFRLSLSSLLIPRHPSCEGLCSFFLGRFLSGDFILCSRSSLFQAVYGSLQHGFSPRFFAAAFLKMGSLRPFERFPRLLGDSSMKPFPISQPITKAASVYRFGIDAPVLVP